MEESKDIGIIIATKEKGEAGYACKKVLNDTRAF